MALPGRTSPKPKPEVADQDGGGRWGSPILEKQGEVGVSNVQPTGRTMAMNLAHHKIIKLLKTLFFFFLLIDFR